MRQLLKILLLSFSIIAVESGILYLVMLQEEKKEQAVVVTDPLLTEDDEWTTFLSQSKRRDLPTINSYRRFPVNHKPAQQPRSDGRVYRR
jgi:hypothetical protein